MTTNASKPLEGIEPDTVSVSTVDDAEVHAALASSNPIVQQRGVAVCEALAADNVDTVRPFIDDIAALAGDTNAPIAMGAIRALDTVATAVPGALEGRLADLVDAAGSELVTVQLSAAAVLGKLVLERSDIVTPHARELIEGLRATEPDPQLEDFSEVVDDPVTRQTLQEHEEGERQRRVAGRRTLTNVVVALTEVQPEATLDTVSDLASLLDDVDPGVAGGAVDALGALAATDPDAVAPATDDLLACLDHDQVFVRARTIRALGTLGETAVVPDLRAVAESDDDKDIQKLASETAESLTDTS